MVWNRSLNPVKYLEEALMGKCYSFCLGCISINWYIALKMGYGGQSFFLYMSSLRLHEILKGTDIDCLYHWSKVARPWGSERGWLNSLQEKLTRGNKID
jgi:hypothetical protein